MILSPNPQFAIHDFDPTLLPQAALLAHVGTMHQQNLAESQAAGWVFRLYSATAHRAIYQAIPDDKENFPSLAIKLYHRRDRSRAKRESQVMQAFFDFGISLAPRPFYADDNPSDLPYGVLIAEWLYGEPLDKPPTLEDEDKWHRIMTVIGITKDLPFHKHASTIPMMGTSPQNPSDLFAMQHADLGQLGTDNPIYETLSRLIEKAESQTAPTWNTTPHVGLWSMNADLRHFIWDGHHLRAVGWENTDWGDIAFGVADLAAHPDYEEVPHSHWVWFRWEYARLTHHNESVIARATTYTQLLQISWAIRLSLQLAAPSLEPVRVKYLTAQRDRYLKRAQNHFR